MNLKKKIEELFQTIENSKEYQSYLNIKKVLDNNQKIKTLIRDIKILQKKSVQLEYKKDKKQKIIDQEIKDKINKLNSIPIYQEYLRRFNELNDILAESSSNIEQYINSKI